MKLATKKGFFNLKGFVNGVTRSISRGLDTLAYPAKEKNPTEYLSVTYSMPEWLVDFFLQSYDVETLEAMFSAFCNAKETTIRVNEGKVSVEELTALLEKQDIKVEKGRYLPYALRLTNYNYLYALKEFKEGLFQVQDESSMLVGQIADVKEGNLIVDVCAAPGGKSLHAAQLLKGNGKVISRDLSPDKTALIEENNHRLGLTNLEVEVYDALVLDKAMIGMADIVIADLPCSGLGVITKKPDIKYRITKDDLESLAELQRAILKVVSQYVKPGGTLIYSTCTINPEENVKNAKWLQEQGQFT